jgi:hypothetical protein
VKRTLLVLLCASAASAYVPTVNSLLRRSAERVTEGSRTREATFTGTLSINGGKPEPRTLVLRFPLQCRFDNGAQVRGTAASPFGRGEGGTGPDRDLLEIACPLLAYRGVSTADAERILRGVAADAGIDLNAATVLDRMSDRVAVVVGAPARRLDRPQMWLLKDSGAPARLVARRGGRLADLRLLEYENPASAEWFPRIVELVEGDKPIARFEVLETKGFRDTGARTEDDDASRE